MERNPLLVCFLLLLSYFIINYNNNNINNNNNNKKKIMEIMENKRKEFTITKIIINNKNKN